MILLLAGTGLHRESTRTKRQRPPEAPDKTGSANAGRLVCEGAVVNHGRRHTGGSVPSPSKTTCILGDVQDRVCVCPRTPQGRHARVQSRAGVHIVIGLRSFEEIAVKITSVGTLLAVACLVGFAPVQDAVAAAVEVAVAMAALRAAVAVVVAPAAGVARAPAAARVAGPAAGVARAAAAARAAAEQAPILPQPSARSSPWRPTSRRQVGNWH